MRKLWQCLGYTCFGLFLLMYITILVSFIVTEHRISQRVSKRAAQVKVCEHVIKTKFLNIVEKIRTQPNTSGVTLDLNLCSARIGYTITINSADGKMDQFQSQSCLLHIEDDGTITREGSCPTI